MEDPLIRSILMAFCVVFALSATAHADGAPVLPDGYASWPTAIDVTCDALSIQAHVGVTPDGQYGVTTYRLSGVPVAYDLDKETDGGKESVSYGLYQKQWRSVAGVDDTAVAKSRRLTQAALADNGGKAALDAYRECQQKVIAQVQSEVFKQLEQTMDSMSKSMPGKN